MPRKKSVKKSGKKKTEILEEVEKLKIKEIPKTKEEPSENLESEIQESGELDARGIISNQELSRVLGNLNNSPAMTSLEQTQSADDLEGAVAFAPRVTRTSSNKEIELKYSDTKYDANIYDEKNKMYDKETPGFYSAGASSKSETSNSESSNNGNQ